MGEVRKSVCASPSYLDRAGVPVIPADLEHHACIDEEGHDRELWRFIDRSPSRSRTISVAVRPRIALNGAGAAVDAAVRGNGICQTFCYQVVEHVLAGQLVLMLAAFEPIPTPVQLVFHLVPRRDAVLRAFIAYATPRLRAELISIGGQIPENFEVSLRT